MTYCLSFSVASFTTGALPVWVAAGALPKHLLHPALPLESTLL
jgi:hypothetical protein